MKKWFALSLFSLLLVAGAQAQGDKSQRPSPPATVTQTLPAGSILTITYSQPALKGRTPGVDVEPKAGKVWRMGANEATVFETTRDVKVEGKNLGEGKYGIWGLQEEKGFTIIFNSDWNVWGTRYNAEKDVLRVTVPTRTAAESLEKLTYTIDANGKVTLQWGTWAADFNVK